MVKYMILGLHLTTLYSIISAFFIILSVCLLCIYYTYCSQCMFIVYSPRLINSANFCARVTQLLRVTGLGLGLELGLGSGLGCSRLGLGLGLR